MDNILHAAIAGLVSLNIASASTNDPNLEIQKSEVLGISQPVKTQSLFEEKFATESAKIKFETEYKEDPETEAGIETTVQKGEDGKKIITTKITYYNGEEFDKDVVDTKIEKPISEIISKGTKIVWKTLQTADGEIRYWKKMRVYATHYDSRCLGCNDWTAIGMKAGKGVIAVDPSVIKMRSQVYIPGYGKAVAGDTGGAIKGNIIDLGFDDARTAGWSARYVDIYLL
jgi:3D (Asp-Asp-Asp) domain-containing protein